MKKNALIIMIMLAIAALVVATPLTMVSQATSDSSIGLGLGDGETTWAEASETGGTIDSILLAETDIAVTGVTLDKNTITLAIGGTYAFTATVSPSDATNKSIKWSSSNKAVATVDENGVVTAVGTGQITLSVTTADGNFRAFCTVKVTTFTAHATGVYLDKSTMNLQLYGTGQLTATVLPADATNKNVTWSSSNKMVANADATGKVIGITPGTATIIVTTAEGGFTATCVVTVSSPVKDVTLDNTSMTINLYGTGKLTATVLPATATNKDVTWSSSARMVVNVDASGKLTGVSLGTATITAKTVDGNKTATCEVTVVPKGPVLVNSVELDEKEMTLILGSTGQLTATVLPANAADKSVTWTSSNTAAATVVGGLVTAVGEGKTTITVKTVDGNKTATCAVTVLRGSEVLVEIIELNKAEMTLTVGESEQLTATVLPVNATNKSISWISLNPAAATVDQNGLVTAVGVGEAGILVSANDESNIVEICIVTVEPAGPEISVTDVEISDAEIALILGSTWQLTATVLPDNATNKSVAWTSSDTMIATVDETGFVTAIGIGTATIAVETVDGNFTAECEIAVAGISDVAAVYNGTDTVTVRGYVGGIDNVDIWIYDDNETAITSIIVPIIVDGIFSAELATGALAPGAYAAELVAYTPAGGSGIRATALFTVDGVIEVVAVYNGTDTVTVWGSTMGIDYVDIWVYDGSQTAIESTIVSTSEDGTFYAEIVTGALAPGAYAAELVAYTPAGGSGIRATATFTVGGISDVVAVYNGTGTVFVRGNVVGIEYVDIWIFDNPATVVSIPILADGIFSAVMITGTLAPGAYTVEFIAYTPAGGSGIRATATFTVESSISDVGAGYNRIDTVTVWGYTTGIDYIEIRIYNEDGITMIVEGVAPILGSGPFLTEIFTGALASGTYLAELIAYPFAGDELGMTIPFTVGIYDVDAAYNGTDTVTIWGYVEGIEFVDIWIFDNNQNVITSTVVATLTDGPFFVELVTGALSRGEYTAEFIAYTPAGGSGIRATASFTADGISDVFAVYNGTDTVTVWGYATGIDNVDIWIYNDNGTAITSTIVPIIADGPFSAEIVTGALAPGAYAAELVAYTPAGGSGIRATALFTVDGVTEVFAVYNGTDAVTVWGSTIGIDYVDIWIYDGNQTAIESTIVSTSEDGTFYAEIVTGALAPGAYAAELVAYTPAGGSGIRATALFTVEGISDVVAVYNRTDAVIVRGYVVGIDHVDIWVYGNPATIVSVPIFADGIFSAVMITGTLAPGEYTVEFIAYTPAGGSGMRANATFTVIYLPMLGW